MRPVFTSVSQATRPYGSAASTASSTPSEIWSAILSGWPSVTDSEVNRNSLSECWLMAWGSAPRVSLEEVADKSIPRRLEAGGTSRSCLRGLHAGACAPLDEIDDQGHAVHAVASTQAVLDEVGVVAGDSRARVDLDRKARGALADLSHVDQLEAMLTRAAARANRGLACLDGLGEEAVELRRGDAPAAAITERQGFRYQARDVAAGLRAGGQHARAQTQLFGDASTLAVEIFLGSFVEIPLVEHERGGTAGLHGKLSDAQILGGDAVSGVAHDERHIGALGGALGAQGRVVLDRVGHLGLAAHAGGVDED